MTLFDLAAWLLPSRNPVTPVIRANSDSPGWIHDDAESQKAWLAWQEQRLQDIACDEVTQEGAPYRIEGVTRVGICLHKNTMVSRVVFDVDNHDGARTPNEVAAIADKFDEWLGATAVRFTSKSGTGLHLFYALSSPIPVAMWLRWINSWGFNKAGEPEAFPKTEKLSQAWLPNLPNDKGGDTWVQGTPEFAVLWELPEFVDDEAKAPSDIPPTTTDTAYGRKILKDEEELLSSAKEPGRHDQLYRTVCALSRRVAAEVISEADARATIARATAANKQDQEPKSYGMENTIRDAWAEGAKEPTPIPEKALTKSTVGIFRDWNAVLANPLPIMPYLIDGICKEKTLLLVTGKAKSKKSFLVAQMALCLASGEPFMGHKIAHPYRVVVLNLEMDQGDYEQRLRDITKKLVLADGRLVGQYRTWFSPDGESPRRDELERLAGNCEVFVIDCYYSLVGDENDIVIGKETIEVIKALMAKGRSVILVHHDKRGLSGDQEVVDRGSGTTVLSRAMGAMVSIGKSVDEDYDCIEVEGRSVVNFKPLAIKLEDGALVAYHGKKTEMKTSKNRVRKEPPKLTDDQCLALLRNGPMQKKAFEDKLDDEWHLGRAETRRLVFRLIDQGKIVKKLEKAKGGKMMVELPDLTFATLAEQPSGNPGQPSPVTLAVAPSPLGGARPTLVTASEPTLAAEVQPANVEGPL